MTGYVYDDGGRVVPEEAEVVREVVGRILDDGASLAAVVAELNGRGVARRDGRSWTVSMLQRVLLDPRLAGLVRGSDGALVRGSGESLIDRDGYEELVEEFDIRREEVGESAPRRRAGRSGGAATALRRRQDNASSGA